MGENWSLKKYAAALGGVVVMGGIFYFILVSTQTESAAVDTVSGREAGAQMTHEIVFGESGYEPNAIIIVAGDTVVFRNERNHPFWPASNIHPSHDIYEAFDPREPVPAGGEWSFTFDRPGTWNYHDHLRSYHYGTIVVKEE